MKKTLVERQAEMRKRLEQERKLLRETLAWKPPVMNQVSGAVLYEDCTTRNWGRTCIHKCYCGKCAVCGCDKHTSIHGPINGGGRGSKPFGHEFVAKASA